MVGERKKGMSNTKAWRAKDRTSKPNSRQKRNGLYLDANPTCQICFKRQSKEAHHDLPKGHPDRNLWRYMRALCRRCHLVVHQPPKRVVIVVSR
jgi:hypothetical protein